METPLFTELIPSLPEELALELLTRLHCSTHRVASRVCRRWHQLLSSRHFYHLRGKLGHTQKLVCLVQALPSQIDKPEGTKPGTPLSYGITVFDPVSRAWERLEPIPDYPNGLPLFCELASCEGKLVVMGGWDPVSYNPVRDVFVYDFVSHRWRRGNSMPSNRSFFATGAFDGRVYIAGGHDEYKNALRSAGAYDVERDEWTELTQMSEERDECEGIVIGREFCVVSGYRTENQGIFEGSMEVYGFDSGEWRRVEGVWEVSRCPRSCVGVGRDGKLVNWAESDSSFGVGTCRVVLGDTTLVTGSRFQGGSREFYVVKCKDGHKYRSEKIDVPEDFSGIVQSGCCVEI